MIDSSLLKDDARFFPHSYLRKKKKNSGENKISLHKDLLSTYALDTENKEINTPSRVHNPVREGGL